MRNPKDLLKNPIVFIPGALIAAVTVAVTDYLIIGTMFT